MKMDNIKELIQLMKDNHLKSLKVKDGDLEIELEAHSNYSNKVVESSSSPETNLEKSVPKDSKLIEIRSTQIGTFYTQPDEDSTDTLVKVGDKVTSGDQIGLIEIMKLFNEVRVDHSGVIEEILVTNGEPVEYDQVLMLLRTEEE